MTRVSNLGWLIGVVLICLLAGEHIVAYADSPIIINELQYHPLSDDHGEEYVELYNPSATAVDISGWRFSDGIEYTFPVSTSIPAGGYVVVGHNPATIEAVYGVGGVLGPFVSGRLSNGGERVAIKDSLGSLVDEVAYDDHLPWPAKADGDGPAIELISPIFDNDRPCSWDSSVGLGTPGAQNSVYSVDNIPPCITGAVHSPTRPTSDQPVTVTAMIDDNSVVVTAMLHYRPEGAPVYATLPMTTAGDMLYTALIPPQSDGKYVEFYITAGDDEAATRTVPDGAPGEVSAETGLPVTLSYLYLVEDAPPASDLPIYRLIVTQENQAELTTRDLYSNLYLDATFLYGTESYYNVGLRYRGESTRDVLPRPYRIKFRDEQEFEDRERINLVSDDMGRESLAHDLFQRAGLPSSDTRFVTLYVNQGFEGDYLDVEQVDNDFLEAHFSENDDGNLYRGQDGADLHYRGSDPADYAPYYLKKNNEDTADPAGGYADIIALTDALDNASDATFRAEAEAVADMRQWIRWFALQAVLDNHEGALWIGQGDDYFLYRHPIDDRFILISWDHDCTFMYADHSIWEPKWISSDVVERILSYPDFTRWYYQEIASIAADEFSTANMYPRIDALPDVVDTDYRDMLKQYVAERIPALNDQIPEVNLSISTNNGADFTTTGAEVTLEGSCSPLRDVQVNGGTDDVSYPTATTYHYEGVLWDEDNVFTISDGMDSLTITVHWDSFHGGTLTEDTLVTANPYPYAITDNIILPEGVTLTIEPGVTLHFQAERYLRVNEGGRLLAEGTAAQPIIFTRQGSEYWGGILLDQTQEDNRITQAVIEYTSEVIGNPRSQGVSAYGARVTISDSVIRHTDFSVAVQTYPWSGYDPSIHLLRNEIYDIQRDAVHVTDGYAYIQGNHIYDVQHGAYEFEGIEVSHMSPLTPALLLDNQIHDVSDDCLDLNYSSAIIRRNELHHCGDKGISIGHPSSTTLVNNLIYSCLGKSEDPHSGACIAVKDGAVSHIMNNTMADCRRGVYVYEGHAGQGGGSATVVNSILWGHSIAALELDALSAITVTYSDIEGGWAGEGNIDADPLFRWPQNGIYRLLEESPCVDSGMPDGAPDVDIRDIYRPHGEGYERGAHEFFEFFSCYLPQVMKSH